MDDRNNSPVMGVFLNGEAILSVHEGSEEAPDCKQLSDGMIGTLYISEIGGKFTIHYTAKMWTSCRSRRRFVKLMAGVFGIQRNRADALAQTAMKCGCPSYQDLWVDCFCLFIKTALKDAIKRASAEQC